ncbi:hypothetical protein NQ318_001189 [Aromia moschata]|uniref:Transketolase-like pyrimidine-binding domain-containing protein n=1 Tax=Aromia moschata TaxID=1265417 RepID=A0AAV8ZEP7_9CUCU|nr:hypothetical protein NQ318_001189 [Aromia moschata]
MHIISYKVCFNRSRKFLNNFTLIRSYHSDNVFGFKRRSKKAYEVSEEVLKSRHKESNFYRLVTAYRQHAHRCAQVNPVAAKKKFSIIPELEIKRYGFSENDKIQFKGIINFPKDEGTIGEAVDFLHEVYSKNVAAEFLYLENDEEIEWLSKELEELPYRPLSENTKLDLVMELLKSQCFDNFLAKKFSSVKRYGGEGAEGMMAFFCELLQLSAQSSIEQIVLAMTHRGRLNLLTGLLNFPPVKIFSKLNGNPDFPAKYQSIGDVVSHCIASTDLYYGDNVVHVSMVYNPSHLEVANAISMGKTRGKQLCSKDGDYGNDSRWADKILNVQIHGDAAITGQGINQECLEISGVPHFEIGGSIHLVVNNQLGFTTPAKRGRSSRYCTDLAKLVSAPVIHVNGDFPEEVLKVTKLAFDYQRKFRKEIFIDLNCYRQWGHNEMDDPTFTNPRLYGIIRSRGTVPDIYAKKLVEEGVVTEEKCKKIVDDHYGWLDQHLKAVDHFKPEDIYFKKQWEGFVQPEEVVTTWDTGIDVDLMTFVGSKSVKCPENFEIHPTLMRGHVKGRLSKITEGTNIDWSTAEALAIGSLLFEVANSILSEEAVLGYEYGMSVESPRNLIIWEAQFGDFFNGAQIIFDTFITSGEAKWLWQTGLTVLLPHGYDGAGPEHSSCRLERFLQLTDSKENKVDADNVNMQVCQPSTPAQYFHLLRRQMVRNFRKPLIVATPKTLLRHSACVSNFSDMAPGTHFQPVLGDAIVQPSNVKRVLMASGKHYYSLAEKREAMNVTDTAIIRVECFCPFPTLELRHQIAKYPNARAIVWCQEEPQNMGAWSFFRPRFENMIGKKVIYCGRETLAAPAVGVGKIHREQASEVIVLIKIIIQKIKRNKN